MNVYRQRSISLVVGFFIGVLVLVSVPQSILAATPTMDSAFAIIMRVNQMLATVESDPASPSDIESNPTVVSVRENLADALQSFLAGDYTLAAKAAHTARKALQDSLIPPRVNYSVAHARVAVAETKLEEVLEDITDADEERYDVANAWVLYREAEAKLNDAHTALDDDDPEYAHNLAVEITDLADKALNAIVKSTRDGTDTIQRLNDYKEFFDGIKQDIEDVRARGGSVRGTRKLVEDMERYFKQAEKKLDKKYYLQTNKQIDKVDDAMNKISDQIDWKLLYPAY